MLKYILLIITFLCTPIVAENSEKNYSILTDENEIKLVFQQCTRMTPSFRTSYRKLDTKLVEKVEKMLPEALAKNNNGKAVNLDDYYRQYVSFDLLRRELVYVNALHKKTLASWADGNKDRSDLINNWQTKAITVCGQEGDKLHFWGALYDSQYDVIAEVLFNLPVRKK